MKELASYKNWNVGQKFIDLLELGSVMYPRLLQNENTGKVYLCGLWCINPTYMAELWGIIRPIKPRAQVSSIEELRRWAEENRIKDVDWDSVEIIDGNFYYPACAQLEDINEDYAELSDWVCEGGECENWH